MKQLTIVALVCFCLAVASATSQRRTILESTAHAPVEWVLGARVPADHQIHLIFALKQQNLDVLDRKFWEVSNPKSSNYGKYLTGADINRLVAPSAQTVETVLAFLNQHPVKSILHFYDYIEVDCEATVAEALLGAPFHFYTHATAENQRIVRVKGTYSLPAAVAGPQASPLPSPVADTSVLPAHVDLVGGAGHFPRVQTKPHVAVDEKLKVQEQGSDSAQQWGLAVDPAFLRELYKINTVEGKAKNNSQSIVQFIGQYYSQTDLDEFFMLFYRNAYGNAPSIIGPDNGLPGTEANLDTQYIMAVGAQIPTVFWSNDNSKSDPFLQWLLDVDKATNAPWVFSVSYGEDEDSNTLDYVNRCDVEFKKLGLRGISILFASGDSGVGGSSRNCKKFKPDWPASSAYLTAVGGTAMDGILENGQEVTASLSGGGFSNYFPRPAYQQNAVTNYLKTMAGKLPAASLWNSTGRAYPDVSAQAWNFIIVQDLIPMPGVAGTSCAAPTFSGVMALLNDLRIQNGKAPLGFLNPLLYQIAVDHPTVFTDIVKGSNPGCGTTGFSAAKGWDPATGLGTPNYYEFAQYILSY